MNNKLNIVSLISALLKTCSPYAIISRVPFVIINSLKAHAARARPHVSIKILKFLPLIGHCNTSTAIRKVVFAFYIFTPCFHRYPQLINCCSRHIVFSFLCFGYLSSIATARFRLASKQFATPHYLRCSAITSAKPVSTSIRIATFIRKDCPPIKFFAFNIFESHVLYFKRID